MNLVNLQRICRRHTDIWLLSLLLACSVGHGDGLTSPVPVGQLLAKYGAVTVTVTSGGTTKAPAFAVENQSLFSCDVITTSATGRASLLFDDGSQVYLNKSTSVAIRDGKASHPPFRLIAGQIFVRARPGFTISTDSALITVRGTEFAVAVSDGLTSVCVARGAVGFSNVFGAVVVGEGQTSSATATTPPTAPVSIAAGDLVFEWTFDLSQSRIQREHTYVSTDSATLSTDLVARSLRVKQSSTDSVAQIALGDVLSDLHRPDKAIRAYQAALAESTDQSVARERLGYALLDAGRLDEASTLFSSIVDTACGKLGSAWVSLRRNRIEDAVSSAKSVENAPSVGREAALVIGIAHAEQPGTRELAIAELTSIGNASDPIAAQARAWLILSKVATGDLQGGLLAGTTASAQCPKSAVVHSAYAIALMSSGRFGEAARQARIAAEIDPSDVGSEVIAAQSLVANGRPDASARSAARAAAIDPELPEARYVLALADMARGDTVHAERELRDCLQLAPKYIPAIIGLCKVKTWQGASAEAEQIAKSAVTIFPNASGLHAAEAAALVDQKSYARAIVEYRTAVDLAPQSADSWAGLSRACLDNGDYTAAIQSGLRATALAPTISSYHSDLGRAYEFGFGSGTSSYEANAASEYREALTLDPNNGFARAKLALMRFGADGTASGIAGASSVQLSSISQGTSIFADPQRQTSARELLAALTQSMIDEPASVSGYYRGGVSSNLYSQRGSDSDTISLSHHDALFGGTEHDLVEYSNVLSHAVKDGLGRSENLIAFANEQLGHGSSITAGLVHQQISQGFPQISGGMATSQSSSGDMAVAVLRNRVSDNVAVLAAINGLFTKDHFVSPFVYEPDLLSQTRSISGELRIDFGSQTANATALSGSVGYSQAPQEVSTTRLVYSDPFSPPVLAANEYSQNVNNVYGQMTQKISTRLSYTALAQYRWVSATGIGFSGDTLIPSVDVEYQGSGGSLVRFQTGRYVNETTLSTLQRQDTLSGIEPDTLPTGVARQSDVAQLDYERRTGGTFFKCFAYHTVSRRLTVSDAIATQPYRPAVGMERVYRDGLGLRFQRSISPTVFASAYANVSITRNHADPSAADLSLYDYMLGIGPVPFSPDRIAAIELHYQKGSNVSVAGAARFQDQMWTRVTMTDVTGITKLATVRYPAQTYFDMRISKDLSRSSRIQGRVLNVFDTGSITFSELSATGREYELSAAYSF